jgi:hypothetical protein
MNEEEHRKKWIEAEYATMGWCCPVCGRGLAPQLTMCPCEGSGVTLKINHLERVIKRKIDWIEYLENEAASTPSTRHRRHDDA